MRQELSVWQRLAQGIDDPVLRAHALGKLTTERGNTEGVATLCTLAPRRHRRVLVTATVAIQVMYDYLDAVTEQPVENPLRNGRQLFRTFAVALTPTERPVDYYRYHPQREDGGYLDALVACCRRSIAELPSIAAVLPIARDAAQRFREAQVRSHAVAEHGPDQLRGWASAQATGKGLTWWEWAGGSAASVLAVHALLSGAAEVGTTRRAAAQIDRAYLLACAFTTMLDSLVDDSRDAAAGSHRYIAYYENEDCAARRIVALAGRAGAAVRTLPHPSHHAMTVAGIAAFYLSAPAARTRAGRAVAGDLRREHGAVFVSILAIMRLWRRAQRRLP
ncbi:MAG: DUF2600 family protein [Thermoleophilaceae bacterium]